MKARRSLGLGAEGRGRPPEAVGAAAHRLQGARQGASGKRHELGRCAAGGLGLEQAPLGFRARPQLARQGFSAGFPDERHDGADSDRHQDERQGHDGTLARAARQGGGQHQVRRQGPGAGDESCGGTPASRPRAEQRQGQEHDAAGRAQRAAVDDGAHAQGAADKAFASQKSQGDTHGPMRFVAVRYRLARRERDQAGGPDRRDAPTGQGREQHRAGQIGGDPGLQPRMAAGRDRAQAGLLVVDRHGDHRRLRWTPPRWRPLGGGTAEDLVKGR
jgi:hypothetical protein